MNKKTYAQVLDAAARKQIPETLDLAPHILSRIQQRKGIPMQPRLRILIASVASLLVLAVVAFSVPAVRATIQRWFGYMPGVGLVPEGSIRVLAEPVSVTREGFTLTVNEAVLSSDKTFIKYNLTGLSTGMVQDTDPCPIEQTRLIMRLPDGNQLELRGSGIDYSTDPGTPPYYNGEVTFSPAPLDVNEATLLIPCITMTDTSVIPQNWEVPLRFAPAPAEMTVAPVMTVAPASDISAAPSAASLLPGLEITKIVPVDGGYLLAGTIRVDAPEGFSVAETDGYLENAVMTDANGQTVAYGPAPFDFIPEELASPAEGAIGWTGQISGDNFAWPLTLTVNSVTANSAPYPPAQFQFDADPDLPVDQPITLDKDIPIGQKTVRVVSVAHIQKSHGFEGYEFTFVDDPSFGFSLEIAGHTAMGGGGDGADSSGNYTRGLGYTDGLPTGTLTVILHGYDVVQLPGPWQFTLNAPAQ